MASWHSWRDQLDARRLTIWIAQMPAPSFILYSGVSLLGVVAYWKLGAIEDALQHHGQLFAFRLSFPAPDAYSAEVGKL
jgi:hypothetical protein